jgi:uncharacterized RDD family membrane protein YckC
MTQSWYYALEGAMLGPLPEEDLRKRFLRGELPKDTLVWSDGMAAWAPATRVAELMSEPPPPIPAPAAAATVAPAFAGAARARQPAAPARPAASLRRPWARLGARVADILLFQLVVAFLIPSAWIPDAERTVAFQFFMAGLTIVTLLAWTPIEAFCLSRWGMTPGKWIYRVRVVHPDGRFLTFGEAFTRAIQVFAKGMAIGLPGVQLITMALAMKELTETGATSWDRGRHLVQHAQPKPIHQAAVFVLLLVFLLSSVQLLDRFSGV